MPGALGEFIESHEPHASRPHNKQGMDKWRGRLPESDDSYEETEVGSRKSQVHATIKSWYLLKSRATRYSASPFTGRGQISRKASRAHDPTSDWSAIENEWQLCRNDRSFKKKFRSQTVRLSSHGMANYHQEKSGKGLLAIMLAQNYRLLSQKFNFLHQTWMRESQRPSFSS